MAQYHAVTVLENLGLLQLDRGRLDQLPASSIWRRGSHKAATQ